MKILNRPVTGLESFALNFPAQLKGKRIGLLCHAASVLPDYTHAVECFRRMPCRLSALFGPQHGMFGQTQDNMVEWEGFMHPALGIPVYSLYGKSRRPGGAMLSGLDALVVDLQDVGARPYTYIWTVKLCMEACLEKGLPVWVLDRPNPVAAVDFDGPMIREDFYSFVGGAPVPLCHRLTIGELALLMQRRFFPGLELHVAWMEGWRRNSLLSETGLPWVLPSPNMPAQDSAVVYPGMVLLEATNLSEGRGTTRPFEIIGAPYVKINEVIEHLNDMELPGCVFREHGFIPTFQKWQGSYCRGMQVHVTDPRVFRPVYTTVAVIAAIMRTSPGEFCFKGPPYEYETVKMPFDILAGSAILRENLEKDAALTDIAGQWKAERADFMENWGEIAHYPEE